MSDKPNLADQLDVQTVRPAPEADFLDSDSRDSRPLYKNPYVKVGIALIFIFFSMGFASLFLIVGTNEEVADSGSRPADGEVSPLSLSLESPAEDLAPGEASRSEIERLRAENALLEQRLALAEIDRNLRPPEDSFTEPSRANAEATPTPTSAPTMPTTRPASRPAPTSVTTPTTAVRTRPTREALPVRPPARTVPASVPRPVIEPVDPNEIWEDLATSGMVGVMLAVNREPDTAPVSPHATPPDIPDATLAAVPVANVPGLLSPAVQRTVPMGQRIEAETTAPIAWLDAATQHRIRLNGELVFDDGQVAIPEGAYLIAQTGGMNSSNGLAQLIVTGFQIDDEFTPLPSDLIVVNGAGGNPLIANRFGDPGPAISAGDIELFAIGALGEVGRAINEPDSQVITTGTFGSTVSTRNGEEAIWAAVLEGGADQISDRLDERNEDRLDELLAREDIFYLPEAMQLEIYISGDFVI